MLLFKLTFTLPGSKQLAEMLQAGYEIYRDQDGHFYVASIPDLDSYIEVAAPIDKDESQLIKVEKPTSIMGTWAFHLALSRK